MHTSENSTIGKIKQIERHPVDKHVGSKIRSLRIFRNMIQDDVAKAIGLTTQQIQKYEKGHNRVSASKLFELASVFDVSVAYFFHGLSAKKNANSNYDMFNFNNNTDLQEYGAPVAENFLENKESIKLLYYFNNIKNKSVRMQIVFLAKAIMANSTEFDIEEENE